MDVEIWSDIACPWCFVGKRRFEAALAGFEHRDEVSVTWRSFELDPGAPAAREGDHAELLARKYGTTPEKARGMLDSMTQTAAEDGLDFHFEKARSGNTFDGHRLVHLAAAHGRQDAMKERLFVAYLTEGELISDPATLTRLAADVGLPVDEVAELLATERYAEEVRDDERLAQSFGASAVPFFVVDRRFAATGAQPAETLREMLEQAWQARQPTMQVVTGGETCGPDGC